MAAGGISSVPVVCLPRVALLATGDEIIAPGKPLGSGMVYASNVAMQEAWLRTLGINCRTEVSRDSLEMRSRRLSAMGKTKALVKIPEGTEKLTAGTRVSF